MFVTVRYGENQTKIFNADCKNEILLENIKLHCECSDNEVVEVSDERGVVKNLRNFPSEYGSDFLKGRETLVLLTVQNGTSPGSDKPVFTPLLASLRNDPEFNETLNRDMDLDRLTPVDPNLGGGRRQQLPSETDDDVLNKSFKGKNKTSGPSTAAPTGKKSIFRKNAKNSNRK